MLILTFLGQGKSSFMTQAEKNKKGRKKNKMNFESEGEAR